MRIHNIAIGSVVTALLAAAVVAGCGGSGTSTALPGPGGGGHPSPTPTASPTGNPSPSPSPTGTPGPSPSPGTQAVQGSMQIAVGGSWPNPVETPAKHAEVDITCGCSPVAGTGFTDSTGNYDMLSLSTPVPTPNPQYTIVPGRNYMVIGTQTQTGDKGQEWNMIFAGNSPLTNQFLPGGTDSQADTITAAVALWVYGNSSVGGPVAFDDWNFFTLQAFYQHLLTSPTSQETQLMSDIVTEQIAKVSMYPFKPPWRPNRIKNQTIQTDVANINASTDPSVPTPCPTSGCTNTPTP